MSYKDAKKIVVPAGTHAEVKATAKRLGLTMNEAILTSLRFYVEYVQSRNGETDSE